MYPYVYKYKWGVYRLWSGHITYGDTVVIEPYENAMTKLGYDIDEFQPFRGNLNINKYIGIVSIICRILL